MLFIAAAEKQKTAGTTSVKTHTNLVTRVTASGKIWRSCTNSINRDAIFKYRPSGHMMFDETKGPISQMARSKKRSIYLEIHISGPRLYTDKRKQCKKWIGSNCQQVLNKTTILIINIPHYYITNINEHQSKWSSISE